jgi:hypothetical protein
MFNFEDDVIDTKARFHVFIGTQFPSPHKEAFQVCKYSLYSLASENISIIKIAYVDFLKIPSICKRLKLKGRALFITDSYLFKDDVVKLFNETDNDEGIVWSVKFKDRALWTSLIVFNLNNKKLITLLPEDKIDTWSAWYKYNFKWLASRDLIIDFEVRPISPGWNYMLGVTEKDSNIKAINFDGKGPWNTEDCKFSRDWFNEYKLFIDNEVYPKLLTYSRKVV